MGQKDLNSTAPGRRGHRANNARVVLLPGEAGCHKCPDCGEYTEGVGIRKTFGGAICENQKTFTLVTMAQEWDSGVMFIGGKYCFRPRNHPLGTVLCCKKCKAPTVSLPAHPGDWFDCEACGYSWAPTQRQVAQMNKGVRV